MSQSCGDEHDRVVDARSVDCTETHLHVEVGLASATGEDLRRLGDDLDAGGAQQPEEALGTRIRALESLDVRDPELTAPRDQRLSVISAMPGPQVILQMPPQVCGSSDLSGVSRYLAE